MVKWFVHWRSPDWIGSANSRVRHSARASVAFILHDLQSLINCISLLSETMPQSYFLLCPRQSLIAAPFVRGFTSCHCQQTFRPTMLFFCLCSASAPLGHSPTPTCASYA